MKYAACLLMGSVLLSSCGHQVDVGAVQGAPGERGPAGVAGAVGAQGLQGIPGADAASVRVVPLCPGVSSYGTFVEVGICVQDQLYAVYSANGGFMTLLAPGSYSSNAIGSACNLTVSAHCVVTQ